MKVFAFADADSFVKWGAATVDEFPADAELSFFVVQSTAQASERQVDVAVAGTRVAGVWRMVSIEQLRDEYRRIRPDVVVGAARGFIVRVLFEYLVENVPTRPVLVSGLPGISIPVLPGGSQHRAAADVFILHSRREVAEYSEYSVKRGLPVNYFLGTLPFLRHTNAANASPPDIDQVARPDIVFAVQALVPRRREQRAAIADALIRTARAFPSRRVVVKVRALANESQTHPEAYPFDALIDEVRGRGVDVPTNLVIEAGPMAEQLAHAHAMVSVSSTALLEAIALQIPTVVIDEFGVSSAMINTVFEGSGLFGGLDDLEHGRFRQPDSDWLDENYFHPRSANTWLAEV